MKSAKKYEHLDQTKRDRIEALFSSGRKQKEIADILDVDKSTISREKKRNRKKMRAKGGTRDGPCLASLAHHKAYARRHDARYQGKAINENDALQEYIVEKLKEYWSPDAISGRMRKEKNPSAQVKQPSTNGCEPREARETASIFTREGITKRKGRKTKQKKP